MEGEKIPRKERTPQRRGQSSPPPWHRPDLLIARLRRPVVTRNDRNSPLAAVHRKGCRRGRSQAQECLLCYCRLNYVLLLRAREKVAEGRMRARGLRELAHQMNSPAPDSSRPVLICWRRCRAGRRRKLERRSPDPARWKWIEPAFQLRTQPQTGWTRQGRYSRVQKCCGRRS